MHAAGHVDDLLGLAGGLGRPRVDETVVALIERMAGVSKVSCSSLVIGRPRRLFVVC